MSLMAYSLQPTVAVDIGYWSGSAPLVQEKAGGVAPTGLSPDLAAWPLN